MPHKEPQNERIMRIVRKKTAESNLQISRTLLAFAAISFAVWILFACGVLKSKGVYVNLALLLTPALFLTVSIWCFCKNGRGIAFQYAFLVLLAVFWLELELMSGYKSKLLLPLLIVLSLRYYSQRFTAFTFFACVVALFGSVFCNAFLYESTGFIDLNMVSFEETRYLALKGFFFDNIIQQQPSHEMLLRNGILLTLIPGTLFLAVITGVTLRFMHQNLQNLLLIEELADREADQRLELADLKTKNMLSQVKPHFIYNTLSSIARLCTKNPAEAKSLVVSFSEYLRSNLDTLDGNAPVSCRFDTELEHIKNYLHIEQVRFGDKLNVEYDVQTTRFSVPVLSIQTIVENAVKHGICKKEDGGTVRIRAEEISDGWKITVSDDGIGFDKNELLKDGRVHVGIENAEKRLALAGAVLTMDSTPGVGTVATVWIPREEKKK